MIDKLREYRFLAILVLLALFFLISPLMEIAELRRGPLIAAFAVVIFAAANAAIDRLAHTVTAGILALVALVFNLIKLVATGDLIWILGDLSAICLLGFTVAVILNRIVRLDATNLNVLSGAAAVYLLLALVWALSDRVIGGLAPGAFKGLSPDQLSAWTQYLYFSLTTLTTLGYGDITPVNPFARVWAAFEAVVGVFYVAILVARLVSLYRR
jgi:hypothetical protein